jgi:hypothetical protein
LAQMTHSGRMLWVIINSALVIALCQKSVNGQGEGRATTVRIASIPAVHDPALKLITVFTNHDKPIAIRFAPDGRAFVCEKGGKVYMYK